MQRDFYLNPTWFKTLQDAGVDDAHLWYEAAPHSLWKSKEMSLKPGVLLAKRAASASTAAFASSWVGKVATAAGSTVGLRVTASSKGRGSRAWDTLDPAGASEEEGDRPADGDDEARHDPEA